MEMLDGLLKQFQGILDVSAVPPLFGMKNLFFFFLLAEIATWVCLSTSARIWAEATGVVRTLHRRAYWIKFFFIFVIIRPLQLGAEGGRLGTFALNLLLDAALIAVALLRIRYARAESERFAQWTDLEVYESARAGKAGLVKDIKGE